MGWSSFLGFPLALVSSDFRDGSFRGIFYDWNAAYFSFSSCLLSCNILMSRSVDENN